MWNAKIIKKIYLKGQDKIEIEIEYSNGTTTISETYIIKIPNEIKNLALKKIKELGDLEIFSDSINMDDIDLTIPEAPEPTQEEIERSEYINDVKLYRKNKKALEMEIISKDVLDEIKDRLKDNFKPEYLDIL